MFQITSPSSRARSSPNSAMPHICGVPGSVVDGYLMGADGCPILCGDGTYLRVQPQSPEHAAQADDDSQDAEGEEPALHAMVRLANDPTVAAALAQSHPTDIDMMNADGWYAANRTRCLRLCVRTDPGMCLTAAGLRSW